MAHPNLFNPFLVAFMGHNQAGYALTHTTVATTVISGGIKDNLLPTVAEATLNVRILPGDSASGVMARLRSTISDLPVAVVPGATAESQGFLSSADTWGFAAIAEAIRVAAPGVIPVPAQVTAVTDIRHYASLSRNLYRFHPAWVRTQLDVLRLHGVDERISVDDLGRASKFYEALVRESQGDIAVDGARR
jgi:carboxypeptidase PM20D1